MRRLPPHVARWALAIWAILAAIATMIDPAGLLFAVAALFALLAATSLPSRGTPESEATVPPRWMLDRAFHPTPQPSEIGWLIGIVTSGAQEFTVQEMARTRLRHHLAMLSVSVYREMSDHDRQMLKEYILRVEDARLLRALLDALVRVEAIDAAEQIRTLSYAHSGLASDPAIRREAGRAADALEAIARERARTSSLLRPASAPEGDTLLRPACGAQTAPEERLLRPAEGGAVGAEAEQRTD